MNQVKCLGMKCVECMVHYDSSRRFSYAVVENRTENVTIELLLDSMIVGRRQSGEDIISDLMLDLSVEQIGMLQ